MLPIGRSDESNILDSILKEARIEKKAMEFPTQEAMDKYLKEHPDADKSNHKVVEKKKEESKPKEDKSDLKKKVEEKKEPKKFTDDQMSFINEQLKNMKEGLEDESSLYPVYIRSPLMDDYFKEHPEENKEEELRKKLLQRRKEHSDKEEAKDKIKIKKKQLIKHPNPKTLKEQSTQAYQQHKDTKPGEATWTQLSQLPGESQGFDAGILTYNDGKKLKTIGLGEFQNDKDLTPESVKEHFDSMEDTRDDWEADGNTEDEVVNSAKTQTFKFKDLADLKNKMIEEHNSSGVDENDFK